MSNVKLVVRIEHTTIIDAKSTPYELICKKIFANQHKLFIIVTDDPHLPFPAYAYWPKFAPDQRKDKQLIKNFVLKNYSTRTYNNGADNIYYDVHKLFFKTHDNEPIKISVASAMVMNYGTDNIDEIIVWGAPYKNISDADREKIQSANLKYPILIHRNHKIIDGHHRLLKSKLNGKKYISAKIVRPAQLRSCVIKDWVSNEEYNSRFVR